MASVAGALHGSKAQQQKQEKKVRKLQNKAVKNWKKRRHAG
jgi:hypothetical protein